MAAKNIQITLMARHVWFPCYTQLMMVPREKVSYLYSLWIGISAPILNLPRMLWALVLRPCLYGLFSVFMMTITSIVAGVGGRAAGVRLEEFKPSKDLGGK